jgi:hypothetical protein
LRGVSKDGSRRVRGHPSRLAVKNGEHLRMTAVLWDGRDNVTRTIV